MTDDGTLTLKFDGEAHGVARNVISSMYGYAATVNGEPVALVELSQNDGEDILHLEVVVWDHESPEPAPDAEHKRISWDDVNEIVIH